MSAAKWFLDDFWVKDGVLDESRATIKRPSNHPGMHGVDEWSATEASAFLSMPNCGCKAGWVSEGQGYVTGGGIFKLRVVDCTNGWMPPDLSKSHVPPSVLNATSPIPQRVTVLRT